MIVIIIASVISLSVLSSWATEQDKIQVQQQAITTTQKANKALANKFNNCTALLPYDSSRCDNLINNMRQKCGSSYKNEACSAYNTYQEAKYLKRAKDSREGHYGSNSKDVNEIVDLIRQGKVKGLYAD